MKRLPRRFKSKRKISNHFFAKFNQPHLFRKIFQIILLSLKISIGIYIVLSSALKSLEILRDLTSQSSQPKTSNLPNLPKLTQKSIATQNSKPSIIHQSSPPQPTTNTAHPIYNVQHARQFPQSLELQNLIAKVVNLTTQQGLPTQSLSIQLIDLRTYQQAGYQAQELRFPASLSKLFWLVALYAWIEHGLLSVDYGHYELSTCQTDVCQMVQNSDNNSASRILDLITGTVSGQELQGESYKTWIARRKVINDFFQKAGYQELQINQKNFPIPDLNLSSPKGSDLKMRGDPNFPLRNRITAEQAARLMYEIFDSQAVSRIASQKMMQLLTRYDLQTGAWKTVEYNPIEGFLGESLPPDTYFASKVGWTSDSRQEVAYIATQDGKAAYIVAILAEGTAYGEDWEIFPAISKMIFDDMVSR